MGHAICHALTCARRACSFAHARAHCHESQPLSAVNYGGVEQFFYEPRKGLVQSPEAFAQGVARGTAGLAGGIHGEDRRGNPTFFGFVTMAIGCVHVESHGGPTLYSSEEIASVAAVAKRRAKHEASGFVLIEADESTALLRGQIEAHHGTLD